MTVNFLAIILLTIASSAIGMLWFSTKMFGKTWMKIHNKSETMVNMKNILIAEFVLTFAMNTFLYLAVTPAPKLTIALITACIIWTGFVLPSIASSVIWGNDDKKFMFKKILISSLFRLVMMLIATIVFVIWN